MSNSLLEIKAVLDGVLQEIDYRKPEPDRVLRRASRTLLSLEDRQDDLPDEVKRKFSNLLSCLHQNAWIQHPEAGLAEIKRFHVTLLKAIQLPNRQVGH